ncbi:MAG: hypothetical protein [Olavius algarvensis Delta 4 endosymbiont]|nr:MAG: hypothetical protein [Olavius algarvensis Delta 4 endosymbiont]
MNKWLGLKGLAVGLGVIVLVAIIALLMIDGIIEKNVEKYGTQAVGARVDLAGADLSLFPLGVTLTGLEVTNPDSPMENAVKAATIKFTLDAMPLLEKKVIIDDMTMDRVQFNTPRQASGAVPGLTPTAEDKAKEKAASRCGAVAMPALGLSDVSSILSSEKLESLDAVKAVKADIATQQTAWKKKLGGLPDQEKLESYKARFEKLTGGGGQLGGFLTAAGDIQNIQKDIQRDLDALKNAQNNLNSEIAVLNRKIDRLAANPMADVNRLADKYALSPQSLSNMSRVLMGDQMCQWVQKALGWYDRFKKPGTGKQTPEAKSEAAGDIPFVLVRKAEASVVLKSGTIKGVFKDITTMPQQLGKPTTFELAGQKLDGLDLIKVLGSLDHSNPAQSINTLKGIVQGYLLENFKLPADTGVPIVIKKAIADLEIDSSLRGEDLAALITAALKQTSLSVDTSAQASPLVKALGGALEDLSTLTANADVNGTLENYIVTVKSDVDRILKSAMGKVVHQQTAALKKQLKTQISAQLQGPAGEAKGALGGFGDIQGELEKRLNIGGNVLGDLKLPL